MLSILTNTNIGTFGKPFISLSDGQLNVQNQQSIEVGDICIYDSEKYFFIKSQDIDNYRDKKYSIVGICYIPSSHNIYSDGSIAVISTTIMSCDTPETGSNPRISQAIYCEYNKYILPIDSYFSSISPYINDKQNTEYIRSLDFKGKYNTNRMCLLATSQPNWETDSSIINSNNIGYYPAACCCKRYSVVGANDWYLPSAGELGYIAAKYNIILNVYELINDGYFMMPIDWRIGSSTTFGDYVIAYNPYKNSLRYGNKNEKYVIFAVTRIKLS